MQLDMEQSIDSATLVRLVDDALGGYYQRTPQGQASWGEIMEASEQQPYPPFIPSFAASLNYLVYVAEPQTQPQTQVHPQNVDMEQFQLVQEDHSEDIDIPQAVPRITEEALDNRFGGGQGRGNRTDNNDRDLLHMVADEFVSDPIVAAIQMPQFLALGYTEETIQEKLMLLKKRPSISKTELFYLILDPRITDPFKRSFARFFEFYLDNYLAISAEQSRKIKKLSTFIKHHRSMTSYLCRLSPLNRANNMQILQQP